MKSTMCLHLHYTKSNKSTTLTLRQTIKPYINKALKQLAQFKLHVEE